MNSTLYILYLERLKFIKYVFHKKIQGNNIQQCDNDKIFYLDLCYEYIINELYLY